MYQICIITVRKRSLGLGNIFTSVCFSTGGLCSGVSVQQGISVQGVSVRGSQSRGSLSGGSLSREGFCHRDTPRHGGRAGSTHPIGMDSCWHFIHRWMGVHLRQVPKHFAPFFAKYKRTSISQSPYWMAREKITCFKHVANKKAFQ